MYILPHSITVCLFQWLTVFINTNIYCSACFLSFLCPRHKVSISAMWDMRYAHCVACTGLGVCFIRIFHLWNHLSNYWLSTWMQVMLLPNSHIPDMGWFLLLHHYPSSLFCRSSNKCSANNLLPVFTCFFLIFFYPQLYYILVKLFLFDSLLTNKTYSAILICCAKDICRSWVFELELL